MAPKVGSPAGVVKFIRERLNKHPEQGAAIMLAVQSGVYDGTTTKSNKFLSDVKRLDKVPDEYKIDCMKAWLKGMSAEVWAKVQKATYENGQKNEQILQQCFRFMALTSEHEPLPTRSRALLKKVLTSHRSLYKTQPKLAIKKNFRIDWAASGVYSLSGEEGTGAAIVYRKVRHNFLDIEVPRVVMFCWGCLLNYFLCYYFLKFRGHNRPVCLWRQVQSLQTVLFASTSRPQHYTHTQVSLPKSIVLHKASAVIKYNYDQTQAVITNTDADFEKRVYDMFPADVKKRYCIKAVVKEPAIAKDIDDALEELNAQLGIGSASPSSVGGDDSTTPVSKRRKLTKTLSDVSIPDGLKAEGEAEGPDA